MLVSKRITTVKRTLQFYIDGQRILTVDEFVHLGNTVGS